MRSKTRRHHVTKGFGLEKDANINKAKWERQNGCVYCSSMQTELCTIVDTCSGAKRKLRPNEDL